MANPSVDSGSSSCVTGASPTGRVASIMWVPYTDRSVDDCVKLPELRQMVRDDLAMQDLLEEQEK